MPQCAQNVRESPGSVLDRVGRIVQRLNDCAVRIWKGLRLIAAMRRSGAKCETRTLSASCGQRVSSLAVRALFGLSLAASAIPRLGATLVTPPTLSYSCTTGNVVLGQTAYINAASYFQWSDNSDGNDWNGSPAIYILRVILQKPDGSQVYLSDWLPNNPVPTPGTVNLSYTVDQLGQYYIQIYTMDTRPWTTTAGFFPAANGVKLNQTISLTQSTQSSVNSTNYLQVNHTINAQASGSSTGYAGYWGTSSPGPASFNTSSGAFSANPSAPGVYTYNIYAPADATHNQSNTVTVSYTVAAIPTASLSFSVPSGGNNGSNHLYVGQSQTVTGSWYADTAHGDLLAYAMIGCSFGDSGATGWGTLGQNYMNYWYIWAAGSYSNSITWTPNTAGPHSFYADAVPGDYWDWEYTGTGGTVYVANIPTGYVSTSAGTSMYYGQSNNVYANQVVDTGNGDALGYTMLGVTQYVPGAVNWGGTTQYYTNYSYGTTQQGYTFTPTNAGNYDFYSVVLDCNWWGWRNVGGTTVTVNKTTPSVAGWGDQSRSGTGTFPFNAYFYNPFNGQNLGVSYYVVVSATGTYSSPTSGGVGSSTTFMPGSYVIRAVYNGDGNHNSNTADVTFTVIDALPYMQSFAATPSTINFGQTSRITSTATDSDGNMYFHGILHLYQDGSQWYRGPMCDHSGGWWGNHSTEAAIYGASYTNGCTGPNVYSDTKWIDIQPTWVGTHTFHSNAHDGWNWASGRGDWGSQAGYAYLTVNKATPNISGWNAQSRTGTGTFPSAFTATASNPYSGSVAAPSGGISYAVVGASGTAPSPTSGSVGATTTFAPGTYTVRAAYSGDGNYNATSADVTFSVSNQDPFNITQILDSNQNVLATSPTSSVTLNFGQTFYIKVNGTDPDGRLLHLYSRINYANTTAWDYPMTTVSGGSASVIYGPYNTATGGIGFLDVWTHVEDMDSPGFAWWGSGWWGQHNPDVNVVKATPVINGWSNQSRTGTGTFPFAFTASPANPYTGGVTAPTGGISYSVVGVSGGGASPTSGAVTSSTSFLPGTFTVRASYPGDGNYNATTADVTFTVINVLPVVTLTANGVSTASSINFGQSIAVSAAATDSDGNLQYHGIMVQNPTPAMVKFPGTNYAWWGSYSDSTVWTSISQPVGNTVTNGSTNSITGTILPSSLGSWLVTTYAQDQAGAGATSLYCNVTVNKTTPNIAGWANQSATGLTAFPSAFSVSLSNPYSGAVAQPSGSVTFSVVSASGNAASPPNGAVSASTAFMPGTYTVRASYAGDSNYLATTWDVTFTVLNRPPVVAAITGPTSLNFGQSGTWSYSVTDPDGDLNSGETYFADPATAYGVSNNWWPNQTIGTLSGGSASWTRSFTPYTPGTWQAEYRVSDHGSPSQGYPGWYSWQTVGTSNSSNLFSFTVNKSTPNGSFIGATKTPQAGITYTVQAGDLNATFANAYDVSVTAPGGAISYSISPSSATGTPGTAITAGSTLTAGFTYIIRATIAADANYNTSTVDTTWNINKANPTVGFSGMTHVYGDSSTITLTSSSSSSSTPS